MSLIDSEMPDTASPILVCAWAAVYEAFSVSFWVRNASTRAWSCCVVASSRSCCWASWSCWVFSPSSCEAIPDRRVERLGGEVLTVLRQRLSCLVLQLGRRLLQLLGLELDPLLRRCHIGEATLDLLELLDLLLVGEIERLAGVLGPVEDFVRLGLDDVRQPFHHTHVVLPCCSTGQHRRVGAALLPAPIAWPAMDEQLCLLSVHAHPDDEASKGAGTVAKYHAAGVHTVLVTCTGGEEGEILNPAMDTPEVRADIWRRSAAASSTGRPRSSATTRWSSSATATRACRTRRRIRTLARSPPRPLEETVERLVAEVRRVRPQVILTYGDDQQYYPHPDHIRVHDISVAAFDAAGDPARFPNAGPPFTPLKMYYSVWSRARIVATHAKFLELGLESPYDERWLDRPSDDDKITTSIDLTGFEDVRRLALLAHATQVDPTSKFWFGLPPEVMKAIHPYDDYILARSLVETHPPEEDLFAGVRLPTSR